MRAGDAGGFEAGVLPVRMGEDDGRQALLVSGVVQSIAPADSVARGGYWAAMLPPFCPTRALILGLGGGTLANLLQLRWGSEVPIVGVDDNAAVMAAARAAGWLELPGLSVVHHDAFAYVENCQERFDYVAIDLYRGHRFDGRGVMQPFLRQVRALLDAPAWVAVNLFQDARAASRVERIGRVFAIERQERVKDNLVLHARARR